MADLTARRFVDILEEESDAHAQAYNLGDSDDPRTLTESMIGDAFHRLAVKIAEAAGIPVRNPQLDLPEWQRTPT